MLKMKIGDKQLIVEDGAEVIIDGDEIHVKPSASSQPVYAPMALPWSPQPIYLGPPHPWYPNAQPGTTGGFPFPPGTITVTCNGMSPTVVGEGAYPLAVGSMYVVDSDGNSPYLIRSERTQ